MTEFCGISNAVILCHSRICAHCGTSIALSFLCIVFLNAWHLYEVSSELLHMFIYYYPSRTALFSPLSFHFTHRNNEEENLLLASTSNWQNENLSQTKRETPMASGSTVSVTYIPWRFHVTKYRKLLCPSSCHVTPLTHSSPPHLPVVWLSVLSAHSLAPALMFLISLI